MISQLITPSLPAASPACRAARATVIVGDAGLRRVALEIRVGLGFIEEGQQSLDLVPGLATQAADRLKELLGSDVGGDVERARAFAGHSCGILRINLSQDLPHSLGQACHGATNTAAGRLVFKLEYGNIER
jgi:hypothetical protein